MNHATSLQAGTRVDDYEITEALWTTNAGFIYRARDPDRDRDVLIQEYLPSVLATRHWSGIHAMALEGLHEEFDQGLTQFLRAARVVAQIHDPYVCRVYEYTETNATAYMVLDYEPGRTLKEHLAGRRTRLDEGEIRKLLVPLLKGLRIVHAAGLLHRDIHPANVYLRDVGPPVLIGFGSPAAAPRDDSEQHIESRVAPGYSPVEQYQSDGRLGPWSDLYALGATMYRCLSGAAPVEATRRLTDIAQEKEDPLVPATELGVSDYSSALLSAIDWMMEPMAAARPESAGAVLGPLTEDRAWPGTQPTPGGVPVAEPARGDRQAPPRAPASAAGADADTAREHARREPPGQAAAPAADNLVQDPSTALVMEVHRGFEQNKRRRWAWPLLAGLAALALAAFFTVYDPPSSQSVAVSSPPEEGKRQAALPAEEEPYPPPDLPETVNFGREHDDRRAAAYRDLEQQANRIEQTLAAARKNMEQGRLVSPAGDNALAGFRSALVLEPDNIDARQGIAAIQAELVESAEAAFAEKDIDTARRLLDRAAEIREESDRGLALRGEIQAHIAEQQRREQLAREAQREREAARRQAEQERREQVESLLAQAEAAFETERLTRPPDANALAYYRRALELDPGNAAAQQGVERVGRYFLDHAANALATDELDQAEEFLSTAATILPDSESILLLQKQLDTRRDILEQEQRLARLAQRAQAREEQEGRERLEQEVQQQKVEQQEQAAGQQQAMAGQVATAAAVGTPELEEGIAAYYSGDYDVAYRLLKPLADQGEARAMFRLATMYLHGRGVERDVTLSRSLIRDALPEIREQVADNAAWAQADLASLYAEGIVLAENDAEAVRLYRLAAEQGYAGAQTNLGVMYANGEGVTRDRDNAVAWLQRAAAQGDRIAQKNLRALGVQ